jgi:hypothetical protein
MIAGVREIVHDLHLSADGALAYLVSSPQERASTLHILDVRSGEERVATPLAGNIVSRGWLPGDRGVVLARATQSNENRTASVEVLVASRAGTLRPAGVVEQAILATVRLDPARAVLYLARVAGGVHNLHEFSLASRRLRPITDNAQPGVTFSGIEPLDSGGFVVVRHERKSDVWLVNATASSPHIAGTSPQ